MDQERCLVCRKVLVAGEDDFNLGVSLCSEHAKNTAVIQVREMYCDLCDWELTYREEDGEMAEIIALQHRVDCGPMDKRIMAVEELFRRTSRV